MEAEEVNVEGDDDSKLINLGSDLAHIELTKPVRNYSVLTSNTPEEHGVLKSAFKIDDIAAQPANDEELETM